MDACPSCPVRDGLCYPRRAGSPGLCLIPSVKASVAGWGAEGGPVEGVVTYRADDDATIAPGFLACRHRRVRGRCEAVYLCALGHGQAGVVDEPDCLACPDATP